MTEREMFETAFKKAHSGVAFWLNSWNEDEQDYGHTTASWAWLMWQASASREGYKLVPVEATAKMRMAAYTMDGDLVGGSSDIYKAMIGATL